MTLVQAAACEDLRVEIRAGTTSPRSSWNVIAASDRTDASRPTPRPVLSGIDLTGRVAIVTGASGGLGEETARALASRGCAVTIAARDAGEAEKAAG